MSDFTQKELGVAKTIDTIVEEVTRALAETEAGRKQVRAMDTLVERLNQTAESLRQKRASLRTRSGISFSVNTTQAQGDPLKISARVSGVDCGVVVFEQAQRIFWPSSNFTDQWHSDKETCDQKALAWGEPAVARFIKACGCEADVRKYDGRESSVQEWLFRAMKGDGRKKTQLRHFQPVLFGGVPIQIPLPVTPRGRSGSEERGKHKGHSDVLARSDLDPIRWTV